jgi:hypothetical protein
MKIVASEGFSHTLHGEFPLLGPDGKPSGAAEKIFAQVVVSWTPGRVSILGDFGDLTLSNGADFDKTIRWLGSHVGVDPNYLLDKAGRHYAGREIDVKETAREVSEVLVDRVISSSRPDWRDALLEFLDLSATNLENIFKISSIADLADRANAIPAEQFKGSARTIFSSADSLGVSVVAGSLLASVIKDDLMYQDKEEFIGEAIENNRGSILVAPDLYKKLCNAVEESLTEAGVRNIQDYWSWLRLNNLDFIAETCREPIMRPTCSSMVLLSALNHWALTIAGEAKRKGVTPSEVAKIMADDIGAHLDSEAASAPEKDRSPASSMTM